jgi:hypothetical protein
VWIHRKASFYFYKTKKMWKYSCNRPWMSVALWDVEVPVF